MINPKLNNICKKLYEWCGKHSIRYDICIDESDIQGVMLLKCGSKIVKSILEYIKPYVELDNVYLERRQTRSGTIIAISLKAISETTLEKIANSAGDPIMKQTLEERINNAFEMPTIKKPRQQAPKAKVVNFVKEAKQIANTLFQKKPKQEERIKPMFERLLGEALEGMATPTGSQPNELFKRFSTALNTLGQAMNIGSLQEKFKQQGIKWRVDDDGSGILLYILNATTKTPQPIARISSETLEKPHDFEQQLSFMLDFAKGQAPGTDKQRKEEMNAQEKTVRDISQQYAPQQEQQQQAAAGQVPTDGNIQNINTNKQMLGGV